MYQKIIAAVAAVMFTLLAVVVSAVAEFHDRGFPTALAARWSAQVDFANSGLSDARALRDLTALDRELNLGLVKVLPNPELPGGELFAPLNPLPQQAKSFHRYGNTPRGEFARPDYLQNSVASGTYLILRDGRKPEFDRWLRIRNIRAEWTANNVLTTAELFTRSGFAPSLVAALALIAALSLFWLAIRARARALQVLAGVPTWKIALRDLRTLGVALSAGAILPVLAALAWIVLAQGLMFVPFYAQTLGLLILIFLGLAIAATALLSLRAWPSAAALARREPAAGALLGSARGVRILTFMLLAISIWPTLSSYTVARNSSENLDVWHALSNQATINLTGLGDNSEKQFLQDTAKVAQCIKSAQEKGIATLSLAWTKEPVDPDSPIPEKDFGKHGSILMVSTNWLELIDEVPSPDNGFTAISVEQVSPQAKDFLESLWSLWARNSRLALERTSGVKFYDFYRKTPLASSRISGDSDLAFVNRALVIIVDDAYGAINNENLASLVTTDNILFTGLDATNQLVTENGIAKNWRVTRAAENGILMAEYAKYFAWLRAISTIALIIALVLSTAVGAYISALVYARHDFPLRLYGRSWPHILGHRISRESVIIFGIGLLIAGLQTQNGPWYVLFATVGSLFIIAGTQIQAARWNFRQLTHRKI